MWFLSRQHKVAYLQVPKAACTSIRFLLLEMERPGLVLEHLARHDNQPPMRASYELFMDNIDAVEPSIALPADAESFFRFSFVRNPLRRCVSAYSNKICFVPPDGSSEDDDVYLNRLNDEFFQRHFKPLGFNKNMPFGDFVEVLARTPVGEMDSHFVPQVSIVNCCGVNQVDMLGRIERFEEDVGRIFPEEILPLSRVRFNEGGGSGISQVPAQFLSVLEDYYNDDLRMLRYSS